MGEILKDKDYDYNTDLEIDKYSLDMECMDQPRKFAKWSELLADAIKEKDTLKAKLSLNIRTNPEAYGLGKTTESGVQSAIESDEEYIQARYNVNVLTGAKDAMEQRRSMIEYLIKLFLSGYWAEPRIPQKEREEINSVSTGDQKQELKKRMDKK